MGEVWNSSPSREPPVNTAPPLLASHQGRCRDRSSSPTNIPEFRPKRELFYFLSLWWNRKWFWLRKAPGCSAGSLFQAPPPGRRGSSASSSTFFCFLSLLTDSPPLSALRILEKRFQETPQRVLLRCCWRLGCRGNNTQLADSQMNVCC